MKNEHQPKMRSATPLILHGSPMMLPFKMAQYFKDSILPLGAKG